MSKKKNQNVQPVVEKTGKKTTKSKASVAIPNSNKEILVPDETPVLNNGSLEESNSSVNEEVPDAAEIIEEVYEIIENNESATSTNLDTSEVYIDSNISKEDKNVERSERSISNESTVDALHEIKTSSKKGTKKKSELPEANTTQIDKKIKLVATCYHYYRNWLKDWMRSHNIQSARFVKNHDSYNGHIAVLENEKVQALNALALWSKENPDTKQLFWDIQ